MGWFGKREEKFEETSVTDMQGFGERIRELRLAKGYTQQSLGDELGISAQAVSKWENGVAAPDISLLVSLARLLGVSLDELFGVAAGETPTGAMEISEVVEGTEARMQPSEAFSEGTSTSTVMLEEVSAVKALGQEDEPVAAGLGWENSATAPSTYGRRVSGGYCAGCGHHYTDGHLHCSGCHQDYRDDEQHCVLCHEEYGFDEHHCMECHEEYDLDEQHCQNCHQNYDMDEKHCMVCHENYDEDEHHCQECHENYDMDELHCSGCHETYDATEQHCLSCHETYDADEIHCADCHETYDADDVHCSRCHVTYDVDEGHVCRPGLWISIGLK